MNERIRQLAEQAANGYLSEMEPVTDTLSTAKRDELAQKAKHAGIGIIPLGFSEKFAELIVKECIDTIDPKTGTKWIKNQTQEEFWKNQSVHLIKKHFGVEE